MVSIGNLWGWKRGLPGDWDIENGTKGDWDIENGTTAATSF
jgi:hypothetical protein